MYKLIKNRTSQSQLYNWAKPTIISAWASKSDTTQAMDMFAVWKAEQYLAQYNHQKELERRKAKYKEESLKRYNAFTGTDWKGRIDGDAKIYAFCSKTLSSERENSSPIRIKAAEVGSANTRPIIKEIKKYFLM